MSLAEQVKMDAETIKNLRLNSKFNYCCPQHLVAEFGIEFKEVLDYRRGEGPPKQCFSNTFKACLADESLIYCEGYATSPQVGGIPIHHAWCVNEQGQVIDLTTNLEDYFGIPFTHKAMLDHGLYDGECWSLIDNWKAGWPILNMSEEKIRNLCAQPGAAESEE